ncbi:MAG: PKD domain-containing protein, partial [Dehalococcoidia bacterium]
MKRRIFSLITVVMLIVMTLPATSPPPVQAGQWPVIGVTVDTSMGASLYILDRTEDPTGNTYAIDQDTGLPIDGLNHLTPAQISVAKNHCYTVWVERTDSLFKVKNKPKDWTGLGYKEANGCIGDNGHYSIHFTTKYIADNNPPVADANGPYEACVGEPITFDGSDSDDPDKDDTLEYRWDFDSDGTYYTDWSSNSDATHTWSLPHSGNVTLEVRDLYGGTPLGTTDTDTAEVTVHALPECNITAPDSVCEDSTENTASTTASGDSYTWSLSAGTITGGQGTDAINWTAPDSNQSPVKITLKVTQGACESYCDIEITVYDEPGCHISADPGTEVCAGTDVTLTEDG